MVQIVMTPAEREKRRAYQREYMREWRNCNREKVRGYAARHYAANHEARLAKSQQWRERHRVRLADLEAARRLGLCIEEIQAMRGAHSGQCDICGHVETKKDRRGNLLRLAIDHCHSTGLVRGQLCNVCNRAIGMMGDNPDLLEKAVEYLRRDR